MAIHPLHCVTFAGALALPFAAQADPLNLIDPFAVEANTHVAEMFGEISIPNVGSGITWLFDSQLPFSGSSGFGRQAGDSLAWGSLDTQTGVLNADLVKATGFAHTSSVYTLDVPTAVTLSVSGIGGARAAASLSLWGPAAGGVPQPQNPGYYGFVLWEVQTNSTAWLVQRWTYSGGGATIIEDLGGGSLDSFDWSLLDDWLDLIADGRSVAYFEAGVDTSFQGISETGDVHAQMSFAARATPAPAPPTGLLAGLALPLLALSARRRRSRG